MKTLYNINSLVIWEEKDIRLKRFFEDTIEKEIKSILLEMNPQWKFFQIEAPSLIPLDLVNVEYSSDDIWIQEQKSTDKLALKPETTASSYIYAEYLLDTYSKLATSLQLYPRQKGDGIYKMMRVIRCVRLDL